ncbi:DUF3422 family protein [Roseovarius sp. S4756]|uniref:DUF3422 family protein n=1 Tax=Roseovarius maritimus TaxID=3342637 RepID=UPI003726D022
MTSSDTGMPSWTFHADRDTIVSEPHARPSIPIDAQDEVFHLGLTCGPEARAQLPDILGIAFEEQSARHWMAQRDGYRLKLEQHTEFVSITLVCAQGASGAVCTDLLKQIAATPDIEVLSLTRVVMNAASNGAKTPPRTRLFGGIMRGGMEVRSSLAPDASGFITYDVRAPDGSPDEVGRRVQRLIEMETYRTLSLLGLPMARRTGEDLARYESGLIDIVNGMSSDQPGNDEKLFEGLSRLLQDSNALRASTRFRFAASRAYYNLAQQRLDSLEEAKLDDLQTLNGFVRSRLDPSMATIESVATRQKTLIDDLSQALSLLRTRIDLAVNRDNQASLKSLDARNRQQVMIAQTVEGLSAVAITYYAVGLLSYVLKSVSSNLPVPVSHTTLVAISVPVVLIAVWTSLHRMRAKWHKE